MEQARSSPAAATREIGAVRAVTASMTISTFVLAVIALVFGKVRRRSRRSSQIPLAPMLAMGALGVFNTALAYYVYFRLVNEEGPTFASLNNYVVPLIGVVGGAVALAEPVASSAWADWPWCCSASPSPAGRCGRRKRL